MTKRKSIGCDHSMCVQPMFVIGTYDENGTADFAPITWLSVTHDGDQYLIVISLFGTKKTKMNVIKTGRLSANLVSTDMLPLADYFGGISGHNSSKTEKQYGWSEGTVIPVPTLDDSKWVYELEVEKTVSCGESDTYFCAIRNVQISEDIDITNGIDLTDFDPVIYSGRYHSIGKHLGKIGDFR